MVVSGKSACRETENDLSHDDITHHSRGLEWNCLQYYYNQPQESNAKAKRCVITELGAGGVQHFSCPGLEPHTPKQ